MCRESKGLEESRVGGRGYEVRMSPLHGEFEQLLLACSVLGKGHRYEFQGGGGEGVVILCAKHSKCFTLVCVQIQSIITHFCCTCIIGYQLSLKIARISHNPIKLLL